MTVLVWSEKAELHDKTGAVHDCAYSAILMCLVYAGKRDYAYGIYTATEREALERSDNQPDETGASSADIDLAIHNRYGLAVHKGASTDTQKAILTVPGRVVSIGGIPANAPVGSPIRKYTSITSGHRVAIRTSDMHLGDPLAPFQSEFIPVPLADVLAFAKGRTSDDLRWTVQDEFATQGGVNQPGDVMGFHFHLPAVPQAGTTKLVAGQVVYRCSDNLQITISSGGAGPHPSTAAASRVEGDPNSKPGSLVDVTTGGVTETCFAVAAAHPFTPDTTPNATVLAPGTYEVKA